MGIALFAMKWFRSIISLVILLATTLIGLIVTSPLRIVQLHYPRAVENDPLRSPLSVRSVSGSTLVLEDGRTFHVDTFGERLDQIVGESGFRVDVEAETGGSHAILFAKRRGWICGTPWEGWIAIPLIPDDVPINQRQYIGSATLVADGPQKGK